MQIAYFLIVIIIMKNRTFIQKPAIEYTTLCTFMGLNLIGKRQPVQIALEFMPFRQPLLNGQHHGRKLRSRAFQPNRSNASGS